MRHFGLDPDTDITIVPMGSLQNRTAGLQNGAIQAAPANPPDAYVLQRQGFRVLFDVSELGFPSANATIVTQRVWLKDHRDVFQAWNDSIVEAISVAKQQPEIGLPALKRFLQSDDDDLMRPTYDYWINKILKQPPVLAPEQFTDVIDALAKNNPRVKDIDVRSMIDTSFVQSAVDKGLATQP
jgi:ABC-type nitrate/sulfonate/bicarbonate transport system substrate-binding protein